MSNGSGEVINYNSYQQELRFRLREVVRIPELERRGTVVSISISMRDVRYEVRYFDNAEVRHCYFYEDEIVPTERIQNGPDADR